MAIPKSLKMFVDAFMLKKEPGPPGSGQERVTEGEITKREPSGKGLFGGKPFVNRQRFRKALEKAPPQIPGGGSFTRKERLALEEELFPKSKFGRYITPYEVNRRLRRLKKEVRLERGVTEKIRKRKQFRYLESLKGKKEKNEQ